MIPFEVEKSYVGHDKHHTEFWNAILEIIREMVSQTVIPSIEELNAKSVNAKM